MIKRLNNKRRTYVKCETDGILWRQFLWIINLNYVYICFLQVYFTYKNDAPVIDAEKLHSVTWNT